MITVNIIGAGRVGRTFLRLLGPNVRDIASANRTSAEDAVRETGQGMAADPDNMREADIWLLTVPDTQITAAAQALSETAAPPAVAVHCSGFHTADIMAPLAGKGWQLASAHPNLSFADPAAAAANFSGTPCGLEGDARAVAAIETLLAGTGALTFHIASNRKALYHAAAVFSNNFATVLQAIACEAWTDAGVPAGITERLNASLINATAANVTQLGPQNALTGPAARGDMEVIAAQARQVRKWNAEAGRLYDDLTRMALRLKTTGTAL